MGKSVLYGQVTFGRNHSHPSTSITEKVAKMEKFPPSTERQLHLKTVLFFFGTTTFLNVNSFDELRLDNDVVQAANDVWRLFISTAASREVAPNFWVVHNQSSLRKKAKNVASGRLDGKTQFRVVLVCQCQKGFDHGLGLLCLSSLDISQCLSDTV